jgi:hypothetical protein
LSTASLLYEIAIHRAGMKKMTGHIRDAFTRLRKHGALLVGEVVQ